MIGSTCFLNSRYEVAIESIVLILAIAIASCDPVDTRLKIHNRSHAQVFYLTLSHDTLPLGQDPDRIANIKTDTFTFYFEPLAVDPDSVRIIPIIGKWEGSIENLPRKMLYISIVERSDLEAHTWREIVENKIYTVDSFTVERLNAIDWTVEYWGRPRKE